jgi:hypothetical protein
MMREFKEESLFSFSLGVQLVLGWVFRVLRGSLGLGLEIRIDSSPRS